MRPKVERGELSSKEDAALASCFVDGTPEFAQMLTGMMERGEAAGSEGIVSSSGRR